MREQIQKLRDNSGMAFWHLTLRPLLWKLYSHSIWLVVFALYCAPLFLVGPTFYREARSLITLRSEGVQVPSENVSILRVHFVNESFLAEVSYAFTPDPSGAESTEPKLRSDFAKEPPDAIRDHLHNLKSGNPLRAWYQGRSLVFESTARRIEKDGSLRFVTYQRDNPRVSAIGPITNARIWLLWLGGGRGTIASVVAIGLALYLTIQAWLRRASRRARQDRRQVWMS